MANDSKSAAYAQLAAEAEVAVAAVKDPELRRVAFEKILATLIEEKAPGQRSRSTPRKGGRSQTKGRTEPAAPKSLNGPKHYVEELIADDFFKQQRTIAEVKAELANRGRHIALTSL